MIYKFNPTLFSSEDVEIHVVLAKLVVHFLEERFLWDFENLVEIFDNEELPFDTTLTFKYLSEPVRENLDERLDIIDQRSTYITQIQHFYLRTIVIGLDDGEVSPSAVLRIIEQPSFIFVENLTNDWNFIRGIIDNYAKHKDKKGAFGLIQKAYENYQLIPIGVGGGGEFQKYISTFYDGFFKNIGRYKMLALFDSDRDDKTTDTKINDKWYKLLKYLKNEKEFDITDSAEWSCLNTDKIGWHMLYKKEQENYMPKQLLFDSGITILEEGRTKIDGLEPSDYDFFDFGKYLDSFKNECSQVFLNYPIRDALEERCKHHKIQVETPSGILEEVSELEKIVQMIAKIL